MVNSRIRVSDTAVNTILLPEVNGKCPLCGKFPLSETKNGRLLKYYEIAHIYPHSPTPEEESVLSGVTQASDAESLENLIVLCKDCHGKQDFHTTREEYIKLYNIKKRLSKNSKSKENLGKQNIEIEILEIISSLKSVNLENLKMLDLTLNPLRIEEKVRDNSLFSDEIREKVIKYFSFIQEQFRILDSSNGNSFPLIASQVRTAYIQANKEGLSQEDVFSQLSDWLNSLDGTRNNIIACQIIVSFFIQNCEVYDEFSE